MAGFNKWAQVAQGMKQGAKEVVSDTAKDIATTYSATAPVDTGFMASTAYVVTSEESTYGQGFGTPPKGASLLPEVDKPGDDYTAYAAVAANYAGFVEYGTRFAHAQPAFYPAVDAARVTLDTKIAKINDDLQAAI